MEDYTPLKREMDASIASEYHMGRVVRYEYRTGHVGTHDTNINIINRTRNNRRITYIVETFNLIEMNLFALYQRNVISII